MRHEHYRVKRALPVSGLRALSDYVRWALAASGSHVLTLTTTTTNGLLLYQVCSVLKRNELREDTQRIFK